MTVSWKQAVNIPTMSDLYNDLPFKNLNSFQRITIYANQQGVIAQQVEQWLILQHVMDDGETVDLIACDDDFDTFLRNQEETMLNCETELTSAGKKYFQNIEENA